MSRSEGGGSGAVLLQVKLGAIELPDQRVPVSGRRSNARKRWTKTAAG
jgi:hypothetical protein